jgi:two-component system, HptB-dependent secretion and biofilm response regulator
VKPEKATSALCDKVSNVLNLFDKTTAENVCIESENCEKELSLLVVEDDQLSRELLLMRLDGLFRCVFSASDGDEGFRLFCEHNPDIILTDQLMPGLSGLELMHKIRATGAETPLILMTSTIDNQILLDAINAGVERFVPKPFDFELLTRTLTRIAGEICNERLLEQHRRQEVELLRHRDAYNSMQQESARLKERHVVRHDLRNQVLEGAEGNRWGISVAYSPRDIMCGDGYSVRNLFDGRQLIFVVDAMGSGISASLSAMLSTSFFNYQVENLHLWETFTLRIFLKRFQEYLSSMLLEEEVLSCGFLLVDLIKEEAECAFFALPPLLVRKTDGSVRRVPGNNPPLGIYFSEVKTTILSLSDVAELLVMTDGVTDAPLAQGGSYREVVESDFHTSPTLASFQRRFRARIDQSEADDLTLIHLRRLSFDTEWKWHGEPDLTLLGLSRTIKEFLDAFTEEVDLGPVERDEVELVLTEALTNALEHGCFGISREEKAGLLLSGEYEDALERRIALPDARMSLFAILYRGAGNPLLIMEVQDNGPGFPGDALKTETDKNSVNGRGLRMISRYSDSLFIGGPHGCLIILKTLEGGNTSAD